MQKFQQVWIEILAEAQKKPLDFQKYGQDHQIKKLHLDQLKIQEIRQRMMELSQKYEAKYTYSSKIWMENQYRIFIWAIFQISTSLKIHPLSFQFCHWIQLSLMFNKPPLVCNYFYLCSRKGKSPPWSIQEDQFLMKVMNLKQYESRWTDIGLLFYTQTQTESFHTPKAIRERWLNHVNPSISKQQWSLQQDLKIVNYVLKYGKKWSKLSRKLENRSEHAIKNRYNGLIFRNVKCSRDQLRKYEERKIVKRYKSMIQKRITNYQEQEKKQVQKEQVFQRKQEVSPFKYDANSLIFCYVCPTLEGIK